MNQRERIDRGHMAFAVMVCAIIVLMVAVMWNCGKR